jgi:hypothetical protein
MACNLQNAYLNTNCCEMIWFEGGKECHEDAGKVCIVIQAFYGLKSAGSAWHAELAGLLHYLGYFSMKANPDVWIHEAVRDDGFNYYEMLIIYVDDILHYHIKQRKRLTRSQCITLQ